MVQHSEDPPPDTDKVLKALESFQNDKEILLKIKDSLDEYQIMDNLNEIANAIREIENGTIKTEEDILKKYCAGKYVVITGRCSSISEELINRLDKTATDTILEKSNEIKKLKESIEKGNGNTDDLLKTAKQKCQTRDGVMTEGLKIFFNNLETVSALDNSLRSLEENNEKFSTNTSVVEREKFENTFKTESENIQKSLDNIKDQIVNHPDTQPYLLNSYEAKKTKFEQIKAYFDAIKERNSVDDDIFKLKGTLQNNDGVTFESVGKHIEQFEAKIGELPENASKTKPQTSLSNLKTDFEKLAKKAKSAFKEIQTEFSKFMKGLSKVKDWKQQKQLLTKQYTESILPQMEQKFRETVPTVEKNFLQNIYDIAKKETRDMYVNYLKGIK